MSNGIPTKVADAEIAENQQQIQQRQKTSIGHKIFWSSVTILCVAVTTGYGSQVKYSLLNDDPREFYPPFTLMWFNNCCLLICFPAYIIYEKINNKDVTIRQIWSKSATIFTPHGFQFGPFLIKECFFLILYAVGNYSYALSLGKITSSAALTIRSFEISLVYLLSRFVLNEKFYPLKTIAVFLAMAGVILIAMDRQFAAHLLGIFLLLISCGVDTLYKITFKYMAGGATLGQAMLFLSGMAIVNLPLNLVPTIILNYYGLEIWHWDYVPIKYFIYFVLLTFVYNIATIFGTAFLSPLIISIGVLCGIPISIGMDVIFRGRQLQIGFVLGAISLLLSVVLVNFHEQIRGLFHRVHPKKVQKMNVPTIVIESDEGKMEKRENEDADVKDEKTVEIAVVHFPQPQ